MVVEEDGKGAVVDCVVEIVVEGVGVVVVEGIVVGEGVVIVDSVIATIFAG